VTDENGQTVGQWCVVWLRQCRRKARLEAFRAEKVAGVPQCDDSASFSADLPGSGANDRGSFGYLVQFFAAQRCASRQDCQAQSRSRPVGSSGAAAALHQECRRPRGAVDRVHAERHRPAGDVEQTCLCLRKNRRVISGGTKPVKALQDDPGVKFALHDLRRTCRTMTSRLDVDYEIAELVIGHKRRDPRPDL
jgi:hypothetical protein